MIINGREVRFRRTVWGNCQLADMCPKKDINKLGALLQGDYATSQRTAARMIAVLSEGYERAHKFSDPGYEPHPLTEDEALMLDDETFSALFQEAIDAFQNDGKTTVEAEPVKNGDGAVESA